VFKERNGCPLYLSKAPTPSPFYQGNPITLDFHPYLLGFSPILEFYVAYKLVSAFLPTFDKIASTAQFLVSMVNFGLGA